MTGISGIPRMSIVAGMPRMRGMPLMRCMT